MKYLPHDMKLPHISHFVKGYFSKNLDKMKLLLYIIGGGNVMKSRLKLLRQKLGLTQAEFAKGLKLKDNTISTYENGIRVPPDSTIALICTTYNVSEEWLRDGIGEMFVTRTPNQELARFIAQVFKDEPDSLRRFVLEFIMEATPAEWDLWRKRVEQIKNRHES